MISFNNYNELKDYLLLNKFNEYTPRNNAVYSSFQKKYHTKDYLHIKYFIDADIYDWTWTDKVKDNYTIEYSCQLYQKGTHDAFNIVFIAWNLEQVENHIEMLLANDIIEYYE